MMGLMNLLMISGDRMLAAGKRGAFWYTLEELHRHFDRIDIICPKARGAASSPFANVFLHPSPRGLWYQPLWILRKGKELWAAHRHDVMTVHEYPPFYNGLGTLLLRRAAFIPIVLEIHHIVGWPRAASATERIGFCLSRVFLPFEGSAASAVRCVSGSVEAQLRRWGVANLHRAPSLYLDHDALQPDATMTKSVDVACCGRLVRSKGFDRLLEALALLPRATLAVVGDGPERERLERRARNLGIADRVTWRGWLEDQTAVYRALQTARVIAVPSLSEGGPRIAVEAMALGLPVVATRVGILPDVIVDGENGAFTDGSPADLAAVIGKLLADEAMRQRLGESARGVLGLFERRTLIKQYADFLKSIVPLPMP
ncbi:MAG: putative Glycosyl transferase, group 1 [Candidatus Peregrinibacteria bacterium Gr01-1014_25]|nr:MAG: putative Glycosyl transferase, group 1 [Candidatus Peregrinibacteria bacterium Gr01-1014_25]